MRAVKYEFECEKACRSYRAEDGERRELWTLTVRAGQLPRGLKYGPNARYASLASRPAKEMLRTLEAEPATFILKNNGMMIVAESIRVEESKVTLECHEAEADEEFPGHGVLNGGHTYKCLTHALESNDQRYNNVARKAQVMITVGIGIPEDDVWQISKARNTSEKVPLHALRELAGDWTILKKYLPAATRPLVAFKPNDEEAPDAEYDTTDLVRRLVLLSNEMFPAEEGNHPVAAYRGIGSIVKTYKPDIFAKLAPRLPDVLKLEERIVRYWESINGNGPDKVGISRASGCNTESVKLLSGYVTDGLSLADPFVLPVIAAFRVFVRDGEWKIPMDEAWEKYGPKTVRALWDAYKDQGRSSAAIFGRAKSSWAATCDLTKSAAISRGIVEIA